MSKKVIIYTMSECAYCKELKEKLNAANVEFVEKDKEKFNGEWFRVVQLTGIPIFPTVNIDGEYLVPNRDFQNPTQILNIIEYMTSDEYKEWDIQTKIYEKLKTLSYSINNQFNNLNKKNG